MWLSRDSETTKAYCEGAALDSMRKVVLQVDDQGQLLELRAKLLEAGVKHKLWMEQPENMPTCIATAPADKSEVGPLFKKYSLCKASIGGGKKG